jgi:apolipoprotein N-acyltransferase
MVRVGVLQGNIDQAVKWSPSWAERTLAIYEDLTRRAAAAGAQIVLWPETAVPGSPDGAPELAARLAALARETRTTLVVGAVGVEWDGERPRYHDSAFLYDPEGRSIARYDKAHLVPFGEYVPLRDLLGHFVEALARGVADTDVSAGSGPRALVLPVGGSPAPGAALTAGVPICYELLFPDLVRRFVQDGAEVLLAITNDAWYGRTGAPYQFLAITALRSAENRVWTARAANTGVSAVIDAGGRVREATRIFERDLRVADLELRPPPLGGSFYTRHGDWFAAACWAGSLWAAVWARGTRRR